MSEFDLNPLQEQIHPHIPQGRSALLPALQAAQSLYGYIPEPAAVEIGRLLGVPLADIHGVIDFYSLLYREPIGKTVLRVCTDPACALAGGEQVLAAMCNHLGVATGGTTADGAFTVERAPCLGLCEHAPAVLVNEKAIANADPTQAQALCNGAGKRLESKIYGTKRLLTVTCGKDRPTFRGDYETSGGYAGLRNALKLSPAQVISQVKDSGLVGRGGAAFPTGVKWEGAAAAQGEPKYVVCNADESEPGTFKDRVLLEGDPHRVLEGMIIAAYAIGAHKAYIFLRGEYPNARLILSEALAEARRSGYLGQNILGSGFDLEIELRIGAGAYICGEESALFEAIEGKRGFPRLRPPYPTTNGLFDRPTVINNVETLCNIPTILKRGTDFYRSLGTEASPGTKLFCLSGDVVYPGVYELPFGAPMGELIYNLAGGIPDGKQLQAVLVGGAAGAFATPEQLEAPLSFEGLRLAGLPLGSGALTVIDDSRDLRDILLRLGHFFAHESCGKCYPCQLGTQRQYEILQRVAAGNPLPGDGERLRDVGWTMSDSSICGLGQTAATAVLSAMEHWPEIFTPV